MHCNKTNNHGNSLLKHGNSCALPVIQRDPKLKPHACGEGCDKKCDLIEIEAELDEQPLSEGYKERSPDMNNNEDEIDVAALQVRLLEKQVKVKSNELDRLMNLRNRDIIDKAMMRNRIECLKNEPYKLMKSLDSRFAAQQVKVIQLEKQVKEKSNEIVRLKNLWNKEGAHFEKQVREKLEKEYDLLQAEKNKAVLEKGKLLNQVQALIKECEEKTNLAQENDALQKRYDKMEKEKNEAVIEKKELSKQIDSIKEASKEQKQRNVRTRAWTRSLAITEENKVLQHKLDEAIDVNQSMKRQIEVLQNELSERLQKATERNGEFKSKVSSRKRELNSQLGEYVEKSECKKIKWENDTESFDDMALELLHQKTSLVILKTEQECFETDQNKKIQDIIDNHKLKKDKMLVNQNKELEKLIKEQEKDRENYASASCKYKQSLKKRIDDCENRMKCVGDSIATMCSSKTQKRNSGNFSESVDKLAEELLHEKKSFMTLQAEKEQLLREQKVKTQDVIDNQNVIKDALMAKHKKEVEKLDAEEENERKNFASASCGEKQKFNQRIKEGENQITVVRENMAAFILSKEMGNSQKKVKNSDSSKKD